MAQLREPMPAPKFAERLALTAKFYKWALLLPQNDNGEFARALLAQYPIERIYSESRFPGMPRPGLSVSLGIGVEITPATRPQLVSALANSIRGNRPSGPTRKE